MEIYYSASEKGFFFDGMDLPDDAKIISKSLYKSLMIGQGEGKHITPPNAAHAAPWLQDPDPPSIEEICAGIKAGLDALDAKYYTNINTVMQALLGDEVAKAIIAQKAAAHEAEAAPLREELRILLNS